ncbi:MAG: hypothetical protein WCE75_01605 [Terracidiphilus sp.]
MNAAQVRLRLVMAGAAVAAVMMIAGCGSEYRPIVTPINPNGPPAQPGSYAAVISYPSVTSPGIATVVDYSGDTIVAQAPIGVGPEVFSLDQSGSTGYTINGDGTLTNFPVNSSLQAKNVNYNTLPTTAAPQNAFTPSSGLWIADLTGNQVDVFTGNPLAFKLAIPVATTPVTVTGPVTINQRNYSISLNFADPTGMTCNLAPHSVAQNGEVDSLEVSTFTISARFPTGACPVFGVMSPDGRRFFVLNRGSDTITVINSQANTLDQCTPFKNQSGQLVTCHPSLPLSQASLTAQNAPVNCDIATNPTCGLPAVAGPVQAEYNSATNQLVVADYEGNAISVVDVSLDEYGNDGPTFGSTYSIPVGNSPASVTALVDGSRAYTANQADETVTVVNLVSHTFEKTLPVNGHPRTVVSTQNSQFGKVYVASPDSPYLTILRTDHDIVDATVLVQGNIVDVRVSTQNGVSTNYNVQSRRPGYGQPCNLAGAAAEASLATCRAMP